MGAHKRMLDVVLHLYTVYKQAHLNCLYVFINVFVSIHRWMLVHKQIMNGIIVKHICNNVKCVFAEEVVIVDKFQKHYIVL